MDSLTINNSGGGITALRWIYRLERKLGRNFGVPNIMIYVTGTMLAVYALSLIAMPGLIGFLSFHRGLILSGEVWRILTFALVPPLSGQPLFVLLSLFVAYRIGSNLEYTWGTPLFNMYFFLGVIGAIIAGFISGFGTNSYLLLSLILAFCYINPNATFLLFFILPVKAKHIAIFNWALYILAFIQGNFASRMAILFSLLNFFLFFGPEIFRTMRQNYENSRRRRNYQKNWGNNNPWR